MNKLLAVISFTLLSIAVANAGKLTFSSSQIKTAYEKSGVSQKLPDTIMVADTVINADGKKLSVRIVNGNVEHIGWHLFAKELRDMAPSPAYDYLEFACLDNKIKVTENPFVYSNLRIQGGTWDTVINASLNSACSVSRLENVAYKVEWNMPEGKTVTVSFPIGYEKLYMMSRSEIEQRFIDQLKNAKAAQQADVQDPDENMLKPYGKDLLVLEGEHYIIADVNKNLYYQKTDNEGIVLVWDKKYPIESISNMLIAHDKWLTGYPITLRIPTHERKTEELTVTIRQLLAYAHQTGCEAYWGVESVSETELKGTLFLYNAAYGYDHVLNISCDPRQIGTNDLTLKALATIFSPTTNIRDLFAKNKGKSKPKKIE